MRRTSLAVGVVAISLIAVRLGAQSPPDFSGKWVLVSSNPPGSHALGVDFTISQDAMTLTVASTGFSIRASTSGDGSETPYDVRTIHILDGIEHPRRAIADSPVATPLASTSQMTMTSSMEESISKATWAGSQLVIMTYNKIKITAPSRTPSVTVIRQTVRRALSMGSDGTLAVDSLIVADPMPWGLAARSPTPVRSVYKKG